MGILRLPGLTQSFQPQGGPILLERRTLFGIALDAVVIGGNPVNIATGKSGTKVGSLNVLASPVGLTFDTGTATNPNANSLDLGGGYNYAGPFTLFWYGRLNAVSSSGYDRLFTKDVGGGAGNWTLSLVAGSATPAFFMQDAANVSKSLVGSSGISLTSYDFIVVTHDGVNMTMYKNGVVIGTLACTTFPGINANPLKLGGGTSNFGAAMSVALAGVGGGAATAAQVRALSVNPWQIVKSPQRVLMLAAVSGNAASLAWLEQNDTASIAANVATAGTLAWTEASDTASISAAATVSGAANWTESSDTSAIAATATVNAIAVWTESNDSSALAATASVTAAASWTEAADTASVSAAAQVNCSGAWTEASDAPSITATVGNAVSGSATWTESNDTASLTASATVSGSTAWTEASDITAISASAGSSVAGNVAWTEANDVTAITAAAQVSASAAWTESSDVAAISVSVGTAVAGNAAWVEQNDSVAMLATVTVSASAGWAEQSDLAGFSAQVLVSAGLAWVEQSDATAISLAVIQPGGALLPNPHQMYIGQPRNRVNVGQHRIRTYIGK